MKKLFLFLCIISMTSNVFAQEPPCHNVVKAQVYDDVRISSYPPYSLEMPYEVILSYIAMDTISKHSNSSAVEIFLNGQINNDTLLTIMKHYYNMIDWDPILFTKTEFYYDTSINVGLPSLSKLVEAAIFENSDGHFLDYSLCRASYILHVKVTGLKSITDSSTQGYARKVVDVRCDILDTIKGQVVPMKIIQNDLPIINSDSNHEDLNSDPPPPLLDTTFIFSYSPNWTRKISYSGRASLRDEDGDPWIKVDSEYIVFLVNNRICTDSSSVYYCIRPSWPESGTFLLFPIDSEGIVYDPLDDFGFGTNKTTQQFINALKSRISTIINYPN